MIKLVKIVSTALVTSALLIPLFGCEREGGPAERAGKSVDNALDKTAEQLEKAGESIQDAANGDEK